MKRVLIVGSGGREHALAWKLSQSPQVGRIFVAPGNEGMPSVFERWSLASSKKNFPEIVSRARREEIDLAVIGPDQPLADGIADAFREAGIACFGPSAMAARIESSKSFAKDVMKACGVPTARYLLATSRQEARKLLRTLDWSSGWVVKADGLALGKGVQVCRALAEADVFLEKVPDARIVIEERLSGAEISWMAFCDGKRVALLDPARDYKALRDHNQGPNTGGMGAYSPVRVPQNWFERAQREIFEPVIDELRSRDAEFRGLLYAGLMAQVDSDRFWVLEFNSRFGDPETQVLLPRVEGDLYPWLEACAVGDLSPLPGRVPFSGQSAVAVVAAAAGYPDEPETGRAISGWSREGFPRAFGAGIASDGSGLKTSGGRIFSALGLGSTIADARAKAYENLKAIQFEGMQYRTDIAGEGRS